MLESVERRLNHCYLHNRLDGFVAIWQRNFEVMHVREQLRLMRKLSCEWKSEYLIAQLVVQP